MYYTNRLNATLQVPPAKSSVEIFANVPVAEEFGYFKESLSLTVPETEDCPLKKEKNTVYLCADTVTYSFEDQKVSSSDKYLFAITTVDDDKSLISGFLPLEIR